jgi:hypothetical protein
MTATESWRELNRRVAADLERGEGLIKPVRVLAARPETSKLRMESVAEFVQLYAPTIPDRR